MAADVIVIRVEILRSGHKYEGDLHTVAVREHVCRFAIVVLEHFVLDEGGDSMIELVFIGSEIGCPSHFLGLGFDFLAQ